MALEGLHTKADLRRFIQQELDNQGVTVSQQAVAGLADALRPRVSETEEPADESLKAGESAMWFDKTSGSSAMNFKAKDETGTVVTATVALT